MNVRLVESMSPRSLRGCSVSRHKLVIGYILLAPTNASMLVRDESRAHFEVHITKVAFGAVRAPCQKGIVISIG